MLRRALVQITPMTELYE